MDDPDALPAIQAAAVAAIKAAGDGAALAKACGVTRYAVHQWKSSGVPAGRVGAVSAITGIPHHRLRPDLFPAPAQSEAA
jgi:DNA-binding transcriptional regulator YdaS (Cro superfamily)